MPTHLYIDGTNLFAGQHELFGPKYQLSFIYLLNQINKIISVDKVFFYASYMRRPNRLAIAEALFYREVKKTRHVLFYKGHRSPTSGKEKGVDVHLSVDIVKDSFLGKCTRAAIMSGDADLIYPIEVVKSLGIRTYALFLPNRFSFEMALKANKSYVLDFKDKFIAFGKAPRKLQIISIKRPCMVNIQGR